MPKELQQQQQQQQATMAAASEATASPAKMLAEEADAADRGHLTYALARRMKHDLIREDQSVQAAYTRAGGFNEGFETYTELDAKVSPDASATVLKHGNVTEICPWHAMAMSRLAADTRR